MNQSFSMHVQKLFILNSVNFIVKWFSDDLLNINFSQILRCPFNGRIKDSCNVWNNIWIISLPFQIHYWDSFLRDTTYLYVGIHFFFFSALQFSDFLSISESWFFHLIVPPPHAPKLGDTHSFI